MGWINLYGLIIVVLILLPNILYAIKRKITENKCHNKAMNITEQIGRYGSMFTMVFNIGFYEFGFPSKTVFDVWLISTVLLLLLYWFGWLFYFDSTQFFAAMLLAIIPSILFVSNGFLLGNWLLLIFGSIFSVGHIYVTYQNSRTTEAQ